MQNGVDIYPPAWLPVWRFAAILGLLVIVLAGRQVLIRMLRNRALKHQRRAQAQAQNKDARLVDQALQQLEQLQAAYARGELSAAGAAEQASAVVRETYDAMMNHRTRYQAQYEIASRKLEKLSELLRNTYPVEFANAAHQIPPEAVNRIFALSKEVVQACR